MPWRHNWCHQLPAQPVAYIQDVSEWTVKQVQTMENMFRAASLFSFAKSIESRWLKAPGSTITTNILDTVTVNDWDPKVMCMDSEQEKTTRSSPRACPGSNGQTCEGHSADHVYLAGTTYAPQIPARTGVRMTSCTLPTCTHIQPLPAHLCDTDTRVDTRVRPPCTCKHWRVVVD